MSQARSAGMLRRAVIGGAVVVAGLGAGAGIAAAATSGSGSAAHSAHTASAMRSVSAAHPAVSTAHPAASTAHPAAPRTGHCEHMGTGHPGRTGASAS